MALGLTSLSVNYPFSRTVHRHTHKEVKSEASARLETEDEQNPVPWHKYLSLMLA
jgi:hypothetical protein